MSEINNSFFSKPSLMSLFFTQNKWHQHGVLVHTLRVIYNVLEAGDFKFFTAALLHDVGKPSTAFKKDAEDIEFGEWSFTDHEERSYQMIKKLPLISEYTKTIVRYHYLIRDIKKSKIEDFSRYERKKLIWESLSLKIQEDLAKFLIYDDLGKGKKRRD